MGTNYYLQSKATTCKCCGQRTDTQERLHIGKSSAGWTFALHVIPELGLTNLIEWLRMFALADYDIFDEYGDEIDPEEMIRIITDRKMDRDWDDFVTSKTSHVLSILRYDSEEDFHNQNHSQRGPNNLLRRKIDDQHCIGHGPGTYDYCQGYFS